MGSCCGCGADDARTGSNIMNEVKLDNDSQRVHEKPIDCPPQDDTANGPELKKESPTAQSHKTEFSLAFDNERSTVAGETVSYQRSSVLIAESPNKAAASLAKTPHNYLSPI